MASPSPKDSTASISALGETPTNPMFSKFKSKPEPPSAKQSINTMHQICLNYQMTPEEIKRCDQICEKIKGVVELPDESQETMVYRLAVRGIIVVAMMQGDKGRADKVFDQILSSWLDKKEVVQWAKRIGEVCEEGWEVPEKLDEYA